MSLDYDLPRDFKDVRDLSNWVWEQLKRTEEEFNFGRQAFYLSNTTVEPTKPKLGMIVYAGGGTGAWNPGSGAGFYGYHGGAWVKLG